MSTQEFTKICFWNGICIIDLNTISALFTYALDGRAYGEYYDAK